MSLPVPLSVTSDLESVESLLLSLGMEPKVVAALLQAQAEIAAAHPSLFAHLRLRGIHIESARRISDHQLSGSGHQLGRLLQLGGDEIRRLFELAARSSLQQRSQLSAKIGNKRPRKGQIIRKEGVFTMFQSSLAASLATISVAANADKMKIKQKPLMRLVERAGWPIAVQLPCGPEGDRTVHFLYAAADADMSQLQIKQPVPVCSHGLSHAHPKGPGKDQHACHFIDAYNMVESVHTRDAYGVWSQSQNSAFVQQLLVAGDGAAASAAGAASAAAVRHESDSEGESDDDGDENSDVEQSEDDERVSASASGPSSRKRARTDKGNSAAASAAHSAVSHACFNRPQKQRRVTKQPRSKCSQTQQTPLSAAASSSLPPRVVVKPAPISLPAELQAPSSTLLSSPSPSVAPAIALWQGTGGEPTVDFVAELFSDDQSNFAPEEPAVRAAAHPLHCDRAASTDLDLALGFAFGAASADQPRVFGAVYDQFSNKM